MFRAAKLGGVYRGRLVAISVDQIYVYRRCRYHFSYLTRAVCFYGDFANRSCNNLRPGFNLQDVVARARTGSGKTAAYLLPTFHKLLQNPVQDRSAFPRALILVPTRELCEQVRFPPYRILPAEPDGIPSGSEVVVCSAVTNTI